MTGNVIADAVSGSPTLTGKALRTLLGAFLPKPSNRALGGYTGVSPGTPATTVAATSTTWTVNPHSGVLDVSAATDGPTPYSFDAQVTGAMTAADSVNPRIDLVCVTHNDSNENDGSSGSPQPVITYVTGTAASTPGAPAVPSRSFVLARLNVPKLNNGAPSVSFVARCVVAAGGIKPLPDGAYPSNPYVGQYVDDPAVGLLRWDGTTWRQMGAGGTAWTACAMSADYTNNPLLAKAGPAGEIYLSGVITRNSGSAIQQSLTAFAALPNGLTARATSFQTVTNINGTTAVLSFTAGSGQIYITAQASGVSSVQADGVVLPPA